MCYPVSGESGECVLVTTDHQFKAGDRVRINNNCRQKDWHGLTGKVDGWISGVVRVDMDAPLPGGVGMTASLQPRKLDLVTEHEGEEEVSKELEEYKKTVLEVALRAKKTVDEDGIWCDQGFEEALEELGLELPKKEYAPEDTFKGGTIFFNPSCCFLFVKEEGTGHWRKVNWYGWGTEEFETLEEAFKGWQGSFNKKSVPINDGWENSRWPNRH